MEERLPSRWQLSTPRSPNFHCVSTPANAMGKQYRVVFLVFQLILTISGHREKSAMTYACKEFIS